MGVPSNLYHAGFFYVVWVMGYALCGDLCYRLRDEAAKRLKVPL